MLFSLFLSHVSLVSIAVAQHTNNVGPGQDLVDRSITLSDGKYTVKNLKTGQFLAFVREQTTNIIPVDFTSTVDVQKMNNGHIISGGNQECLSAQFSRNVGGGADNAGVAYACEIGSSNQHALAMQTAKQIWLFVPTNCGASSPIQAHSTSHAHSSHHSSPKHCRHPAWWIHRHPEYVTKQGHSECAHALKSRKMKRSHELSKRGDTCYHIVATDHLFDEVARALHGSQLSTPGGYQSTQLNTIDFNDDQQKWLITSA